MLVCANQMAWGRSDKAADTSMLWFLDNWPLIVITVLAVAGLALALDSKRIADRRKRRRSRDNDHDDHFRQTGA